MSKIIFAADFHYGVVGRLSDIDLASRIIRAYAQHNDIHMVVILGDLFHDRQSLDIEVLSTVCTFMEEAAAMGQEWIVFPGNHDMFLRHSWDINSLIPLRKHLTVIDTVKLLQFDEQRFWVVPFITYEKSYMRVIKHIEQQCQEGDKLLTHIGVRGSILNTCFLLKDWSFVHFENTKFKRVYTGHFHTPQQTGDKVWYPGSPIPFKFDEGDVPHGFLVYDTETDSHEFVNIWDAGKTYFPDTVLPPQFMTVASSEVGELTADDVHNNLVRIALEREMSDDEKNGIKTHLVGLGARSIRWLNSTTKIEAADKQDDVTGEAKNLFAAWVGKDQKGTKELDVSILLQLNNEIAAEGDEAYTIEESESW